MRQVAEARDVIGLLEVLGETVWQRDLVSDEISITPGIWTWLGYPRSTVPATLADAMAIFHRDDATRVLDELDRHLAGESFVYRTLARVKSAGGEWQCLRLTGAVLARDDRGNPERVGGLVSDVTRDIERERAALVPRRNCKRYLHVSAT